MGVGLWQKSFLSVLSFPRLSWWKFSVGSLHFLGLPSVRVYHTIIRSDYDSAKLGTRHNVFLRQRILWPSAIVGAAGSAFPLWRRLCDVSTTGHKCLRVAVRGD